MKFASWMTRVSGNSHKSIRRQRNYSTDISQKISHKLGVNCDIFIEYSWCWVVKKIIICWLLQLYLYTFRNILLTILKQVRFLFLLPPSTSEVLQKCLDCQKTTFANVYKPKIFILQKFAFLKKYIPIHHYSPKQNSVHNLALLLHQSKKQRRFLSRCTILKLFLG